MFKRHLVAVLVGGLFAATQAQSAEFVKQMSPVTTELTEAAQVEQQAVPDKSKPASVEALEWIAKKGMRTGLNDGTYGKCYIALGTYSCPATSRTVSTVRAVGTQIAILNARSDIVKFLTGKASAGVTDIMPQQASFGTEYDKKRKELEAQLNGLMSEFELALADVDAEKASQLKSITLDDLIANGVAKTLESNGIMVDTQAMKSASAERLAKLEARVKELDGRLKELRAHLGKTKVALQRESTTEDSNVGQMVLSGIVVVNSYEKIRNGNYEVAVVATWSPAQERFLRALNGLEPADLKLKPGSKSTADQYVASTRWERVAGSRWFVDNQGTPHIYAVGSAEIRNNQTITLEKASVSAELEAMRNLVLALYADTAIEQSSRAKTQVLADGKGGETAQTVADIARTMSSFVKDYNVTGAQIVHRGEAVSPLTGRREYVVVYEYNPEGRKIAAGLKQTMDDRLEAEKNAQSNAPDASTTPPDSALDNSGFGGEGVEEFQF